MSEHTVLIVGAGLAGSLLAWRLQQHGTPVHLIHTPTFHPASRVAAGLINPVTGQRLVLQEHAEQFLKAAHGCYRQLSRDFGIPFLFEKKIQRGLNSERLKAAWRKRQSDEAYTPYLCPVPERDDLLLQHHTGYLDTHTLLDALIHHFQRQHALSETPLAYHDLHHATSSIQWRNIKASRIVFCEGWRGQHNPWFQHLPFQPAKGDILDLHTSTPHPHCMIHQGEWLLPMHNGRLRLGATYDTQPPWDETPSSDAVQLLLTALQKMPIRLQDVQVIRHESGIRPNTRDKHPFLGFHPLQARIGIFNGFGSKGSLLIPWYAEQMAQHIMHHHPLPQEANIQRFSCV